jgi:hypothetical protein
MGISVLKVTRGTADWVIQGLVQMQMESRRREGPAVSEAADAPVFLTTGREAEGEFRCAECGYGVIVRTVLPQCPMCRGLLWEAHSPFALPAA